MSARFAQYEKDTATDSPNLSMVELEAVLPCSPLSMVGLDPTTQTSRASRKGHPN
jgi:hypothetical protein